MLLREMLKTKDMIIRLQEEKIAALEQQLAASNGQKEGMKKRVRAKVVRIDSYKTTISDKRTQGQ